MNFLTQKIQKYHEKKLNDALQKLKLHQKIKKRLKTEQKTADVKSKMIIEEEISKQDEAIDIWEKNIMKIKEQMTKLQK